MLPPIGLALMVAGSVVVAGAAAPEALTSGELFAPTTTAPEVVETTTTTLAPALEDPGSTPTEDPATTTTTIAPAPPRQDPPPRPKPPKAPPTTEAPSVPNVVGQSEDAARSILSAYVVVVMTRPGPANSVGQVVGQSGTEGTVTLTIGEATPAPPDPEEVADDDV